MTVKMNKRTISLISLILFSASLPLMANIDAEKRFGISFPKLNPITLPDITEHQLDNGITILLSEDRSFPTITIDARNTAGTIFDPTGKTGLASLTAQLLRSGGTEQYSANDLNRILDNSAISLNFNARVLSSSVYVSFLSEDKAESLNILNQVLRYPTFEESAFQTAIRGFRSSIARRNDSTQDIAFREFHKLVYGKENPFARHTEYSNIDNISKEDIVEFHKNHYLPQNMYISIVGDFETAEMIDLMNKTFGTWKSDRVPSEHQYQDDLSFEKSVNLVSRPEADQTWIILGHRAMMTQKDDDYIPMIILNDILGGGFGSRIFRRVRSQAGLAYSPGAHYVVHYDTYGAFYLMSQTRTDKTVEAIEALIDEVRIIQGELVSEEELNKSKESYLNSFIFNYDSTRNILNRQMTYMNFGYPENFLEQIRDRVYEVTVEDIHRVANEYLKPDDLIILAVGNDTEFDRPLSELGEVNQIDITIPRPQSRQHEISTDPDIDPEEAGRQVFEAYRSSAGLDKEIRNIVFEGTSVQYADFDSSRVQIKTYIDFPDKFRQNIATPRGDIAMIYNQGNTRMRTPGGNMSLPGEFKDRIVSEMRSNPVGLANYFIDDFEVLLARDVYIDGIDCYVLAFSDALREFLLFIDKETMLPYQSVYDDLRDLRTVYVKFSGYKEVDGVMYPTRVYTHDENDVIFSRSIYNNIEFNNDIPEEKFATD